MARRTVLTSNFNHRAISFFGTSSTTCRWRTSAHWDILTTSASSFGSVDETTVSRPVGRGGAQLFGLALQVAHRRPAGREVLADPVLVERMVERPTGHREVADEALEAALVTPLLLLVFGGRGRAGGTTCDVISSNKIYLPLYVAL